MYRGAHADSLSMQLTESFREILDPILHLKDSLDRQRNAPLFTAVALPWNDSGFKVERTGYASGAA